MARPTHPRDAPIGKYDISDSGAEAQVCALRPSTQNRRSATHGIGRRTVRIGSEPRVRRDSRSTDSGY